MLLHPVICESTGESGNKLHKLTSDTRNIPGFLYFDTVYDTTCDIITVEEVVHNENS